MFPLKSTKYHCFHDKRRRKSFLPVVSLSCVRKTCTVDIIFGWNMYALCEQRFESRKHRKRMHFNLYWSSKTSFHLRTRRTQTCFKCMKQLKGCDTAKCYFFCYRNTQESWYLLMLIFLKSPAPIRSPQSKIYTHISFGTKIFNYNFQ